MFLSYSIVLHEWHLHRSKLKSHIANIETDLVIVEHVSYSILKHTHTHTYTKQWIFWMMATYNYSFNRLYVHIYSSSIFHTDFHVRQHTHTQPSGNTNIPVQTSVSWPWSGTLSHHAPCYMCVCVWKHTDIYWLFCLF